MTLSPAELGRLLEAHDIRPRKSLGQHFVADPNTVRRVARLAGVGPGRRVIEIGAGVGSLTLALAETGARVIAVEVDPRLTPLLCSVVEPAGVPVVQADALALDWDSILGSEASEDGAGEEGDTEEWALVSNLPYNIATPLVLRVLEEVPAVGSMLVMVQREVGERLAAGVGDPGYGAVSVKVAYWATARLAGRVPASVFVPRPRVESALVEVVRRQAPAVDPAEVPYDELFELVRAGFAHRRKMLRRSLSGKVTPGAFEAAGVGPDERAENLDVARWGMLASCSRSARSGPSPS